MVRSVLTREEVNQLFSAYEVATDRRPWEQARRNPYRVSTADFRQDPMGHWITYDPSDDEYEYRSTAWRIVPRKDGNINVEYVDLKARGDEELPPGDGSLLDDFLGSFNMQEVAR